MSRFFLVAVCFLACLIAAAPAQPQGQRPAFRSTIDVVSLNITVVDGAARYLTDLEQPDFSVFEDGVSIPRNMRLVSLDPSENGW